MVLLIIFIAALPLLLALRVYLILPRATKPVASRQANEACSLGVFLGSGGHTAEMRTLLSGLDFDRYTPRTYVYCPGDDMSLKVIRDLEASKSSSTSAYSFTQLPRARRVAQPLLSTIQTSIITLGTAVYLIFIRPLRLDPKRPWVDVLLVNGPGTCVLLVGVAWIRRILGLNHSKIIYVESFARVQSLSLSGKILRPFVDTFVVQWPITGEPGAETSQDGGSRGLNGVTHGIRTVYQGWLV